MELDSPPTMCLQARPRAGALFLLNSDAVLLLKDRALESTTAWTWMNSDSIFAWSCNEDPRVTFIGFWESLDSCDYVAVDLKSEPVQDMGTCTGLHYLCYISNINRRPIMWSVMAMIRTPWQSFVFSSQNFQANPGFDLKSSESQILIGCLSKQIHR